MEKQEVSERTWRGLAHLSPLHMEVILLHIEEGKSFVEIQQTFALGRKRGRGWGWRTYRAAVRQCWRRGVRIEERFP